MNFERYEEGRPVASNCIPKRTRYCRYKMICIRVGVCLAFVITIVSLPVVFSGQCSAMKNIKLNSNMTRNVVILKAVVKKVDLTKSITIKVQKQFTTKRFEESSIDILTSETLFDVCGSKILPDKAYVFFVIPINESNIEFEILENVYQASKLVLRQVRKIVVELEATTVAATTTTTAANITAANITGGFETTSMSLPGNSMLKLCDENNALTCYYGGTCRQVEGGAPFCFCPVGRAGVQCELVDYSTYTFESSSTDNSLLDMNEAIIAICIMFIATILIIVVGVFVYLKYRRSIETDRNEPLTAMEEAETVGQNRSHETVAMIDAFPQERTSQV